MFFLICAFLVLQSCKQFKKCSDNPTNTTHPIYPGMYSVFKIAPETKLTYVSNKGDTAYATFGQVITKQNTESIDRHNCQNITYYSLSQEIIYTGSLVNALIFKSILSSSYSSNEDYNENNCSVKYNGKEGYIKYTLPNDTLTYRGKSYSDLQIINRNKYYEVFSKSNWYLIITNDSITWKQIIKQ